MCQLDESVDESARLRRMLAHALVLYREEKTDIFPAACGTVDLVDDDKRRFRMADS